MTVRSLSYACGHATEMLLILKNIFDLIIARYFEIWQSIEMSHDFVRGQSDLNLFHPQELIWMLYFEYTPVKCICHG